MPRKKSQREIRKCKMCNVTFECLPNHTKQYCSKKCANADPVVKAKVLLSQKLVWDAKYNGKHPMTTTLTRERHKNTIQKKYNVEHALQCKAHLDKAKQTKLSRYGSETFNNLDKAKQTKLNKYGSATYNGHEKRTSMKFQNIIKYWTHLTPMFSEIEFTGVSNGQLYKFQCNVCQYEFYRNLDNGYIPRCKVCSMKENSNVQSKGEKDIIEYIRQLTPTTIVERDRVVLNGKELDIYLPDKKLAIEFNGIYWHSESKLKSKTYHLKKSLRCASRGIQLLHIYDYQWNLKQEIVKSLLASKLGCTNKIFARKCTVKLVSVTLKKHFLNETHIQGTCNSSVNLGLYYNNELVALATFGKSRYDKKYEWELLRYSTKLYTTVVGGFSKLIQYFIANYQPKNILTYCDRNTSVGNLYLKTGFKLIGTTNANYFYFKYQSVYSREQFQKHMLLEKLTTFDSNLTEYENMQLNGFDRFWDCGNFKFLLETCKLPSVA